MTKTFELVKNLQRKRPHQYVVSVKFWLREWYLGWFKYASGDALMVMVGDQHPPYWPIFLEAYNRGYDVVSGQPTRGRVPLHASFASCQIAHGCYLTRSSELRLLSQHRKPLSVCQSTNRFNKGLYEWIGFKEFLIRMKPVKGWRNKKFVLPKKSFECTRFKELISSPCLYWIRFHLFRG